MAFGDWGCPWDGKPGRYYVQQRSLRADLGRWMSVDPVATEPPYAYVANRPTWADFIRPTYQWGHAADARRLHPWDESEPEERKVPVKRESVGDAVLSRQRETRAVGHGERLIVVASEDPGGSVP